MLGCGSSGARAAETSDVDQLKAQLRTLQEQFERTVREQQQQIEALTKRLDELTRKQGADAEKARLEKELAAELQAQGATNNAAPTPAAPTAGGPAATAPSGSGWSPASPILFQSGKSYLDIGLVATFAAGSSTTKNIENSLELGGHDPNQRGFTVQGVEANFAGAVDPYFRGNANLLFGIDSEGESFIELEEAWLETISLPANLQIRAGQILTDFGRQNPTHPHAWAFVDTPLVLGRLLGPDGLRNPGARVSWLAPTPFYSELTFSVQNSQGETAASFRHSSEMDGLPFAYRLAQNDRGISGFEDLLLTPEMLRYVTEIRRQMAGAPTDQALSALLDAVRREANGRA